MEKKLSQAKANDRIVITDDYILSKLPQMKDKELIVSVVKKSGNRMFCQYFAPDTGSGTLKVTIDPTIKVVGNENLTSLATFLKQERHQEYKPKSVSVNVNGSIKEYTIEPGFWSQNAKNIRLRYLFVSCFEYTVPGSSIVKSFNY